MEMELVYLLEIHALIILSVIISIYPHITSLMTLSCDETVDSCARGSGTPCEDGIWCNGADICDGLGSISTFSITLNRKMYPPWKSLQ